MADTTIDLLKNSSYVGKMDELIAAVKSGGSATSDVEWNDVKNKPTTIGGYGITDAKIYNGTITLGANSITPLTSAPVTSVNSKTGAVVLTANDVGALPDDTVIPTVNNATLTIRRNSVDIGSFTANSANDVNIDINVPTDKSDIGLGNVDNVKQYSATNPPPYPVTSVNGKTGDVKSTFYVTVTQGDSNIATADKTAEEVYAAYTAGYAVYAILNPKSNNVPPVILPMAIGMEISGKVLVGFSVFTGAEYAVVTYGGYNWVVATGTLASSEDIPTIPEYLPNPNALNIKIGDITTSYDGSAAKTVEIPEGVPSVTTADNGKFLRVVNGAWAAVAIADANGVKF